MFFIFFNQPHSLRERPCLSIFCVLFFLCHHFVFGQDFGEQEEIHPSLKATEELNQVHRVFTYSRQSAPRPNINGEKLSSPLKAGYYRPSLSSSSSSFSTSSFSIHSHQDGQDNISKLREFRKQHQPIESEESSFASFTTGDDRFITQSPSSSGLLFRSVGAATAPSPTRPPSPLGLPSHLECPVCYQLVEQQVLDLRALLNRLVAQLEEIQRRPEVVEDIGFQLRLRELSSAVDALLRDAQFARSEEQAILQQLAELRQRVKKVTSIRDSITQLPEIERWIHLAQSNSTNVHALLSRVAGGVADARAFLDKQAGGALVQAWERSRQYGQQSQRLSEIARESRLLAEEHGTDGMEIFRLATASLNTSQTAYRLAKDAISTQEGNKLSMEKLRRQMKSTEELLVKTLKIAEDAQKEALRTYNDALDIYSKSAPSVPGLRADKVNQDAAWVISQSVKIISEVERLLSKYELGVDGGNRKLEEAKLLLQQAQQLQAEIDRLLTETQRNLARAQAAIESGESTLKEAQNTLNTLKEFDQLVGRSKAKAEEALRKVEEIHNLVKEAELKTEQAEKALKGALQDAQEARDIALEAHRIAERASMQVRKLKEAALGVKSKAGETKKRLDLFNVKIEESSTKIVKCEGDGQQDSRMVKDTLEKANQAKNSAADALKKIQSAINTLDSILEELESLDQVDGSLLEELFQRLAKAEQEYKDADLDNRATHLTEARGQQRKWIADYERLIAKLMADVNNVDKIRLALPDKCFRRIRLEP